MKLFGPPNIEKMKARRDVKGLIKALGYGKDANVRQAAAEALAELKDDRAFLALVTSLEDTDMGVRRTAAEALAQFRDSHGLEPFIAVIKGSDMKLALRAVTRLGEMGDARAVESLLALFTDSRWDPYKEFVFGVLKQIGASAFAPLSIALKSNDPCISGNAAHALGLIGDPRAVEPLCEALQVESIQDEVATALGQLGDVRAVEPLTAVLDDKFDVPTAEFACLAAANALEELQWQPGKDALGAKYWIIRRKFDKCVEVGAPALEPLIAMLGSENYYRRFHAAVALGELGDLRALDILNRALTGQTGDAPQGQCLAAHALGQPGDPRVVEPLIAALGAWHWQARAAAASALGQVGDPRAVEPLKERAVRDDNAQVRQAAAGAVIEITHPSFESLLNMLGDKSIYFRRAAVAALGQRGDPRAADPLISILKDEDANTRQTAVDALVNLGIAAPLVIALKDANHHLRTGAADALEELGWQPVRDEYGAWYWAAKRAWAKCIEVGTPAIEPLVSVLNYGTADMRRGAAEALVKIGAPAVEQLISELGEVEKLIAGLRSSSESERRSAGRAMFALRRSKDLDSRIAPFVLRAVEAMRRDSHADHQYHEDTRHAYERGCASSIEDTISHEDEAIYRLDFPL